MHCPFCNYEHTNVKDSRPLGNPSRIKRRRICPDCNGRFTTLERVELREVIVLKKDGQPRPFEHDKLLKSLMIASRKRPIKNEQLEKIVDNIRKYLEKSGLTEITSEMIGQLVMVELSKLDAVAYVRYASVYHDFSYIEDFKKFVDSNQLLTSLQSVIKKHE